MIYFIYFLASADVTKLSLPKPHLINAYNQSLRQDQQPSNDGSRVPRSPVPDTGRLILKSK